MGSEITESIERAAEQLVAGNLVAIPTETVYGLAADATNPEAVAKVFQLKGRPADHPLIVHAGSNAAAWKCCSTVSENAKTLAATFWPGPLTMVMDKAEWISPIITGGQDSVAVRVPSHPVTAQLLRLVDRPLVAPSANRFGRVSPTTPQHVLDEFPDSQLLILDGGACDIGIESTIVDCRHSTSWKILRPGKISESQVRESIRTSNQENFNEKQRVESAKVRVSGDLASHYSPEARVILVEPGKAMDWITSYLESNPDLSTEPEIDSANRILVIAFSPPGYSLPTFVQWEPAPESPELFAKDLYAMLRKADQLGCSQMIIELPEDKGIGRAIRDRLYRAASE